MYFLAGHQDGLVEHNVFEEHQQEVTHNEQANGGPEEAEGADSVGRLIGGGVVKIR